MRQPDYKMIQGGNIQVPMNPQLAGASGRGLARLGSTLAGVGVEASAILQKVKKADEDGKLIDAEEEWENSYAEYQKKMAITQNSPLEWQTGWEKNSQKLRHSIDNMEGSKEFKNNLRLRFTRWDGNVNRSIGRSATKTSFSNTANSYAAKYDRAQSQNNTELMLQTAQEATTLGYWPESRLYEAETAAKKLSITNEQTHGMQTDAFETFEEIETNKWGEDKYTHQRKVAKYRPALNAARRQIVDDAVNGVISGGISTPEDLEKEEYENLLPVQKEKIATFMKKFHDQKHKEWVASPEQQAIISSKVQDGIYNFQPNGEDSDMGYADVKMWINQLNPSAYKDEMQKALDSKQDGKMAEIKTIKDWGKAQINRNRKNALDRVAKPKVVKKTLFDYLEDGFLRNEQNLKDLGFSKGDVKNIMNAKVDRGANIKGDDARSTYSVQLGMFRDVYQSREDLSAGSDFQREMARTMMTGNLNTVLRESDDPATLLQFDEEQDRIHKMYGDLESEYNNHIKTHPKADKENVEEWLKDNNLYIESTIERNPVINPRPGTETGAVDRSQVIEEIALNDDTKRLLFASAAAEVGSQGDQAIQAYMETVTNRALATGKSLRSILLDSKYYPDPTKRKLSATNVPDYSEQWDAVARGSNITNFATDNASSDLAENRIAAGNPYIKIGGETFYVNSHGSGGGGVTAHTDFFNKNTALR